MIRNLFVPAPRGAGLASLEDTGVLERSALLECMVDYRQRIACLSQLMACARYDFRCIATLPGPSRHPPRATLPNPMFGFRKKPAAEPSQAPPSSDSWFGRLKAGLKKTGSAIGGIFTGRRIDDGLFEELETALLAADAGVTATAHLLGALRTRVKKDQLETSEQLKSALADELAKLLAPLEQPFAAIDAKPYVIMVAGVNGVGKTTSIGKLAKFLAGEGLTVLLAAGDTFRAAAREQLVVWGERNGISVISQENADPAAVVFDAIASARARQIDVVIADTAGRLPTQLHLMEELKKVKRVISKAYPGAPHEVIIVLDANTGQNALNQVKAFDDALGVTGLILTKLDGTAKGGVVAAIALARASSGGKPIPLRFIGVGEGLEDLRPFSAVDFSKALVD